MYRPGFPAVSFLRETEPELKPIKPTEQRKQFDALTSVLFNEVPNENRLTPETRDKVPFVARSRPVYYKRGSLSSRTEADPKATNYYDHTVLEIFPNDEHAQANNLDPTEPLISYTLKSPAEIRASPDYPHDLPYKNVTLHIPGSPGFNVDRLEPVEIVVRSVEEQSDIKNPHTNELLAIFLQIQQGSRDFSDITRYLNDNRKYLNKTTRRELLINGGDLAKAAVFGATVFSLGIHLQNVLEQKR